MVLPRVLTAVLLVPFVVAVVWLGSLPFFFFVLAIALFCGWEYALMAERGGYPNQLVLGLIGTALVIAAFYVNGIPKGPIHQAPGVISVFVGWGVLVFLREFIRTDKSVSFLRIITTLAGVFLSGICLGHLLLVRDLRFLSGEGSQAMGRPLFFFLVVVIWFLDTGAWAVGRSIGRWPMAPQISPKKTWIGAVGGTFIACAAGWFFSRLFLKNELPPLEAAIFAFVVSLMAQISDLAESLMKRSFGVKDSSQMLPGHGGILDRFDSFIFAGPAFYYLLIGTGRFG